jgi:hypothetical protein
LSTTLKLSVAAKIACLTTELNSLASGSTVISSVNGSSGVFTNVPGDGKGEGAPYVRLKYHQAALGGNASVNTVCDGWFLCAADGSTYETNPGSNNPPSRPPDFSFAQLNPAQAGAIDVEQVVPAPITANFKVLFRNNTIGQSLAASGNTLDFYYTTDTYV